MSHEVKLLISFACDWNEPVSYVARRHLDRLPADCERDYCEARNFLEALAARTGFNEGRKGGLATWSFVGNYTQVGEFVEMLRPFWCELLAGDLAGEAGEDLPSEFDHVLVMYQSEFDDRARAYEIFWDCPNDYVNRLLNIVHHQLPVTWNWRAD